MSRFATRMTAAWIALWSCGGVCLGQGGDGFSFSARVMGTEFRIVVYADGGERAQTAADAAFARARYLDSLMSDWRNDSGLSRLSRFAGADTCVPLSRDLLEVLEKAQQVAEASGGAFDATVGPLTRLWRWAMRRGEMPPESELADALSSVGYRKLALDSERGCARLLVAGMKLDLGGIAKGYAADEMLEVLADLGLPSALIDAGGDIAAGDSPPGSDGWRVETQWLDDDRSPGPHEVLVSHGAVAASGDRYRFLEVDGVRYSHILDPVTGLGITTRRHVTVVAPSAADADALASAISVIGSRGLGLAERPGFGALLQESRDGKTETYAVGILRN